MRSCTILAHDEYLVHVKWSGDKASGPTLSAKKDEAHDSTIFMFSKREQEQVLGTVAPVAPWDTHWPIRLPGQHQGSSTSNPASG